MPGCRRASCSRAAPARPWPRSARADRPSSPSLVAGGLILLTGAFLAFLFEDLPQATLGAIVVVAIAGFFRIGELRRFARLRPSAIALALLALGGVLVFGVLIGLLIAATVSLVLVIQRLSRPGVLTLARDPTTGAWTRADRHSQGETAPGVIVVRPEGPLFYANALSVKDRIVDVVAAANPAPGAVVLDLATNDDIDVGSLDMLADLADAFRHRGIELRLAAVHAPVLALLRRSGLASEVRIEPTLDAAVQPPTVARPGG